MTGWFGEFASDWEAGLGASVERVILKGSDEKLILLTFPDLGLVGVDAVWVVVQPWRETLPRSGSGLLPRFFVRVRFTPSTVASTDRYGLF